MIQILKKLLLYATLIAIMSCIKWYYDNPLEKERRQRERAPEEPVRSYGSVIKAPTNNEV